MESNTHLTMSSNSVSEEGREGGEESGEKEGERMEDT